MVTGASRISRRCCTTSRSSCSRTSRRRRRRETSSTPPWPRTRSSYVRRDMTDPDGGFYSAEDADSIPPEHADRPVRHKSEGAFYIWSDEEIGEAARARMPTSRAGGSGSSRTAMRRTIRRESSPARTCCTRPSRSRRWRSAARRRRMRSWRRSAGFANGCSLPARNVRDRTSTTRF